MHADLHERAQLLLFKYPLGAHDSHIKKQAAQHAAVSHS